MLAVVVSLKERDAQVELEHDAAYRPDVARLSPTELENHFWCTVVTGRHDRAVVFVIKRCATKVDKSDVGALYPTDFATLENKKTLDESSEMGKNKKASTNLSGVKRCCEIRVYKQNILGLQVSVRELVVVKKLHSIAQLIRDVTHVIHRIWLVIVVLEKVEDA